MKKSCFLLSVVLLALIGSGCNPVYSLKPHYTDDNKIDVPAEFIGQWEFVPEEETAGSIVLDFGKENKLKVRETVKEPEKILDAEFLVQFFKVNDELYFDIVLDKIPEGSLPVSAAMTLIPAHVLFKAKVAENALFLNYPLIRKEGLPPELTYVTFKDKPESKDTSYIFTAPGEVWAKVLKEAPEKIFDSKDNQPKFKRLETGKSE